MSLNQTLRDDNDAASFNNMKFDDAAFEIFFKKYFMSFCACCQYKFGFDLDVAKEVVHTGFIKLWETRQNLPPNLLIKTYLYKIITNNSLDILRHEKVKQKYEKYIEKTYGDAYEIEVVTNKIRPITSHFYHGGFTRAMYLANGDVLLSGSTSFDAANPLVNRTQKAELWILDKSYTKAPTRLGVKCYEGPAVS